MINLKGFESSWKQTLGVSGRYCLDECREGKGRKTRPKGGLEKESPFPETGSLG